MHKKRVWGTVSIDKRHVFSASGQCKGFEQRRQNENARVLGLETPALERHKKIRTDVRGRKIQQEKKNLLDGNPIGRAGNGLRIGGRISKLQVTVGHLGILLQLGKTELGNTF